MRVHELAKELGTESKTVIQILKENESIGTVKNHMSNVDAHQQGVVRLGLKAVDTTATELPFEGNPKDLLKSEDWSIGDGETTDGPITYDTSGGHNHTFEKRTDVKVEEPAELTFTEDDLDETSFDEYIDVESVEDPEDIDIPSPTAPLYKGTSGTSAHATYTDEDRLETEEEVKERIEEESKMSFGQKAFAKAEEMKSAEDETFEKLQEDAWAKKVKEADRKIAEQTVIVERPTGFWGWLKGLFL